MLFYKQSALTGFSIMLYGAIFTFLTNERYAQKEKKARRNCSAIYEVPFVLVILVLTIFQGLNPGPQTYKACILPWDTSPSCSVFKREAWRTHCCHLKVTLQHLSTYKELLNTLLVSDIFKKLMTKFNISRFNQVELTNQNVTAIEESCS